VISTSALVASYGSVASHDLVAPIRRLLRATGPDTSLALTAERQAALLDAARARGREAQARMLQAEGGWLTVAEAAARLGISPEELAERVRQNRVLAIPVERGVVGYPAWQFADGATLPHLEEALDLLREHSAWSRLIFFLQPNVATDGVAPLIALRAGRLDAVRRAAWAHGEQVAL
jgi:hypothetical protein